MPVRVILGVLTRASSAGEVIVRRLPVTWLVGAGVGPTSLCGAMEGAGELLGRFLSDLLAVQMPKVMTSPRAKPMAMAKNTSFFIWGQDSGLMIYCQEKFCSVM